MRVSLFAFSKAEILGSTSAKAFQTTVYYNLMCSLFCGLGEKHVAEPVTSLFIIS